MNSLKILNCKSVDSDRIIGLCLERKKEQQQQQPQTNRHKNLHCFKCNYLILHLEHDSITIALHYAVTTDAQYSLLLFFCCCWNNGFFLGFYFLMHFSVRFVAFHWNFSYPKDQMFSICNFQTDNITVYVLTSRILMRWLLNMIGKMVTHSTFSTFDSRQSTVWFVSYHSVFAGLVLALVMMLSFHTKYKL